ncbi:hypothetical protein GON03_18165 [Nocardioides sp. MAH-18]|uniref:Transcription regulator TrmB N-terminal domain-containing protein n=1 Tax=Nocardioides agri TaxID=2682843 RepID=A0A6L6XV90_9ACTN|nr:MULTISPECIES: helix-turn-helix domain-containing protein [unclassified Nocardioides]MBA2956267.1 hypothetical protein [Nocardioides sp. CGMCC 1.13656]MVQ51110.1 hypothetical protein [Nocardioides sp. MAH-18]
MLEALGLSEDEERAYQRLVAGPSESADEVATGLGVEASVAATALAGLEEKGRGYPPSMREDGWLFLTQGAFTDAAGHYAHSDVYFPEYTGRILVDGQEIWATDWSLFLNEKIADGDHDVVVETRVQRENPFWQLSTDVETRWSFRSEQPTSSRTVLPMIGVDYRMDLSATNSAPRGHYRFEVAFPTPQGPAASRIEHRRVEVSWGHGTTWERLPLSRCEKDACSVTVSNRAAATASLRAEAEDRLGRSVEQTIIDAYAVR